MAETLYFLAVFFIFLRMSSFFMILPAFFPKSTPNIFRTGFILLLSYILLNTVDYSTIKLIDSNYDLVMFCINEIMTGLLLGCVTSIVFRLISFAGAWMDFHIGLSMLSIYDPNSESNNTLLSNLLYWTSIIIFFATDTHHILIQEIIKSYSVVKMGTSIIFDGTIGALLEIFTQYFVIGIRIALPIVFIIIMTDLVLGLISRTVPQLQVMILGMPIKILVGIVSFLIALPVMVKVIISALSNIPDAFDSIYGALPLFIILAADDKTEEATPKKKSDSRKKGQVARSKDVSLAVTLLACTAVVTFLGKDIVTIMKDNMVHFLGSLKRIEFTEAFVAQNLLTVLFQFCKAFLPISLIIMVAGVVANLVQTGIMFTTEPLKPSFEKLNPLKGLKNMFSMRSLVDLIKNLLVVTLVSIIGYLFIKDNYYTILQLGSTYFPSLGNGISELISQVFRNITIVMVIIAIMDFIYQRYKFNKEMRMSKQEVKEEYKQTEGDPQIKSKIKQKQREMSSRRMMQAVPDATVVITNPTHYAVALKYDENSDMGAPKLIAKGADLVALKIKEIAKENDVPIIENKTLARLIYDKVELDKDIPQDMYESVAEILAVVFKMQKEQDRRK